MIFSRRDPHVLLPGNNSQDCPALRVNHQSHIGFINAHTKCIGTNNHANLNSHPPFLLFMRSSCGSPA